ncbi:MAG: hypothetical protein RPU34_05230, partial [Candidatus Sedimenticola sp. (ex Thyasira tokunagai)]
IYGPTPFARHFTDVREEIIALIYPAYLMEAFFASWPRWLSALILLIILPASVRADAGKRF